MKDGYLDILGYRLANTCSAMPEQYDVFKENKKVAYLRLRHGWFYASCPFSGPVVYEAEPEGDGYFEESERMDFLTAAIKAIDAHLKNTAQNKDAP